MFAIIIIILSLSGNENELQTIIATKERCEWTECESIKIRMAQQNMIISYFGGKRIHLLKQME